MEINRIIWKIINRHFQNISKSVRELNTGAIVGYFRRIFVETVEM